MNMLAEEQLKDALKCDGEERCEECSLLSYEGFEDCVRRVAEMAIKLKAELETEKNLHHKYEKLALENAMGYDEVKAARDAAVKSLHGRCDECENYEPWHWPDQCRSCRWRQLDSGVPSASFREDDDNWRWRGPIEGKGVTIL